MTVLKPILTTLVIAAIGGGTYYATRTAPQDPAAAGAARGKQGGGVVSVIAGEARLADVPVYLEGVGSAKARNSITVRPQVDGRLISIKFKEGQDVKKGELLAKIDPVTYQAQLDQAVAKKAVDESQLATIKRDLARYEKVGTLAVSEKQIETQRGLLVQQEAQIKSDMAVIDNLTAVLGYTSILAPIDGRVGIRNVDEGNLVRAGDSTGIVTITEVRPISVIFTLPQQNLPVLSKALANAALKVEAYSTDSRSLLDTGTLQVVDNQVDPQTGTIRIKADFPNDTLQLWPGQFVNVRLLVETLSGATVAPTASVQRGPNGPFVYVIGTDKTVAMRPVKVSQQTEKDAVITEGLAAGEKLVVSGFGRLEDGGKVRVGGTRGPESGAPPAAGTSPGTSKGPEKGPVTSAASPPPAGGTAGSVVTPADASPAPSESKTEIKAGTEPKAETKAAAETGSVEPPEKGRRGHRTRDVHGDGTKTTGQP